MLRQNWREGTRAPTACPFAYTCPSPGHYPWQWYWDSCFTAIAWRRLDRERSRRELESLLAAQREDGFIGHTIFWNEPLTGSRRFTYNVHLAGRADDRQHPAAGAGLGVADRGRRPGRASPASAATTTGWRANRDLDGDGLIWIVQPDESGLDASTQFDAIWGRRAHGLPGFVLLVRRNRELGYDLRRIDAAGGPVCCEVRHQRALQPLAAGARPAVARPRR